MCLFGLEAARTILSIDDDQWYGPVESVHSVHFVRVVGQEPEQQAEYERMKDYLKGDWMMAESHKMISQEIERLRASYDVIIEDMEKVAK